MVGRRHVVKQGGPAPACRAHRWLSVLALLVLVACASSDDMTSDAAPARPASTPPEAATTVPVPPTTQPSLPPPMTWSPSPAEPAPNAKVLAAQVVATIGTYPFGEGTVAAARERLATAGLPPELADGSAALLVADAAGAAEVVYPQFGGLADTAASIMVVTRLSTIGTGGETTEVTRTIDVRLEREGGPWLAVDLASDGGAPPASPPPLSPQVAALLDDTRIELPDSAVWDLQSGFVDPRIADLLTTLSGAHELRVAVLASGHPANVFATARQSNHTAGRGVDIWSVGGIPIIDQQDSPAVRAVVEAALAFGATEVGAPFDTDGPGGRVFTNTVHLDHLHLAFRSG